MRIVGHFGKSYQTGTDRNEVRIKLLSWEDMMKRVILLGMVSAILLGSIGGCLVGWDDGRDGRGRGGGYDRDRGHDRNHDHDRDGDHDRDQRRDEQH
jgi:hypothetical protein